MILRTIHSQQGVSIHRLRTVPVRTGSERNVTRRPTGARGPAPCNGALEGAVEVINSLGDSIGFSDLRAAKKQLLELVEPTDRGMRVSRFLRGMIEEAQVAVEAYSGAGIPYELLPGKWRLVYTTAADVIPIIEAEYRLSPPIGPSPIQVGGIFQRFSGLEEGVVENIIELSTPFLLRERNGVTFTVKARYEVMSPHRLSLVFEEAAVGDVRISEGLESLIAPALLPRTSLQHAALMFLSEFKLRFPFSSARQLASRAAGSNSPIAGGGDYLLTFLDQDMLIGRASALGGTFIFTKEKE